MQIPSAPFQGPAELMKSTTRSMARVSAIGMVVIVAVLVLFSLLPTPSAGVQELLGSLFSLGATAFGAWYLHALSQANRPRTEPVMVYADLRGLALNGVLVTPREGIRSAAIRLSRETTQHAMQAGVYVAHAAPMSVEIVTEERAWNLVVGDIARSEALLAAMGLPPICIPADQPRPLTREEQAQQRPVRSLTLLIVGGSVALSLGSCLLAYLRR